VESFIATLKQELIHRRRFWTPENARKEIVLDDEIFGNREQVHCSPGYVYTAQHEWQPAGSVHNTPLRDWMRQREVIQWRG